METRRAQGQIVDEKILMAGGGIGRKGKKLMKRKRSSIRRCEV